MLSLPPAFIKNIHGAFEDAGREWLRRLPAELEWAAERWDLRIGPPFELSFNYVTAARSSDGSDVVLKLGVRPRRDWQAEVAALRLYDGVGGVRLLDADAEHGALLLERLRPGALLAELGDDERMNEIAAGLMRRTWREAPAGHDFPLVRELAAHLNILRPSFGGTTGPFAPRLVEMAESFWAELSASQTQQLVLHGDLHHYNILRSGDGWKLIDPKGMVGEPAFEVASMLLNPYGSLGQHPDLRGLTRRRLDQWSELLGIDRARLVRYAVAFSVVSAWWDMDAQGHGGELTHTIASILAEEC